MLTISWYAKSIAIYEIEYFILLIKSQVPISSTFRFQIWREREKREEDEREKERDRERGWHFVIYKHYPSVILHSAIIHAYI